ncbi:unnamed protein product [Rhizophagus irregularis]|nr:unnamed protein product [Rhizophagus irregularis]
MLSILIQRFLMEPIDDFGGSGWNLSMILIGIRRFRMEPIDDFSWNSEVLDRTYQRYWNSELEFGGPGCRITALDSYFEGPGSVYGPSVPNFGDNWFFGLGLWRRRMILRFPDFEDNGFFDSWILKTTGSSVLDFGDEGFFSSWRQRVLRFLDFEDDGYRRPSLWIGIGALHFGLVSAKPFHIGETLHFGSVSVRSFTLDLVSIGIGWDLWIGIGCDLWKPVVSISIGWNLLDRCQVGTFGNETCGKYWLRPLNRSMASWSATSWIAPEWNFEGLQVPGRFLNANLNSCLLESNQLK